MTREKLSIQFFGKKRFYLGLIVGFLFTIVLYCFSAYFREILRAYTFDSDLITPTKEDLLIYNFFFSAIAVTAGFGIMVWFWFHALFKSERPRRRINYISAYALFWTMTLLYVVLKAGTTLTWILYTADGYDDHLNFAKEFYLLLLLLPTVFFLNIWTAIRLSYRSGMWLLKSLAIFILMSTVLAFSSPVDQANLNKSWETQMAPYNTIVDEEIKNAIRNGIEFSDEAVNALRFNKKQRALTQARNLKERFKWEKAIPTDSVVLELIIVKKTTIKFLSSVDQGDNGDNHHWPFPFPKHIFQQIRKSNDSIRTEYLKNILIEYKKIFSQENSFKMGQDGGLSQKYYNRFSMKHRYGGIEIETNKYLDLLNEK